MAACVTKDKNKRKSSKSECQKNESERELIRYFDLHHLLALLCIHVEKAALRVVTTLVQTVACELSVTLDAVKLDHAGEELPE